LVVPGQTDSAGSDFNENTAQSRNDHPPFHTKESLLSTRKPFIPPPAASRLLMSGNEAIARAVWETGVRVAAAYPGTPSTEILENVARYPDLYAEWSVNEKVSLEVAIGASLTGARSFCAMKHVGLNVAADALMTLTLTGVVGGLVIAVADDVGFSSSQNEQDSRFWGRFAHLPILEPADSQEAYAMTRAAFALSEKFNTPVILRLTTRICHVKCRVDVGARKVTRVAAGFVKNPERWVMVPANAQRRVPEMFAREKALRAESESSDLNRLEPGADRRVGFVTSGPAYMHVRETFPDAPVLKLGLSHPAPLDKVRELAAQVDNLVVVEETEQLLESEIRAAGIAARGKDILPAFGELPPPVLRKGLAALLPELAARGDGKTAPAALPVFPRPPTMCVACPHLGVYYTLSQLRNVNIAGDIGCYTLGAGHPWNALDTCISMGASMGVALGMDKGRGPDDEKKKIVAVIGDSTFMHMGMQGLLDIAYNRGSVTVLLLDNRAVGMTGGQDNPGSGRDIHGEEAPRVDFARLVEALGIAREHIRVVDPYALPVLFKTLREETKYDGPSVIITNRPCVLIDEYEKQPSYEVIESACTGCGNCVEIGCPAIHVSRREKTVKPSGKEVELAFASIEKAACTGCGLCLQPCAPKAIRAAAATFPVTRR
jgi:indolepyruvate ferredoxin oxidoreductase alpha subunit